MSSISPTTGRAPAPAQITPFGGNALSVEYMFQQIMEVVQKSVRAHTKILPVYNADVHLWFCETELGDC